MKILRLLLVAGLLLNTAALAAADSGNSPQGPARDSEPAQPPTTTTKGSTGQSDDC